MQPHREGLLIMCMVATVTHVPGLMCYLCDRLVPRRYEIPMRRTAACARMTMLHVMARGLAVTSVHCRGLAVTARLSPAAGIATTRPGLAMTLRMVHTDFD